MAAYNLNLALVQGQPFSIQDTIQQAAVWAPSTVYASGVSVVPNPPNGFYYASGGGTSGTTQPTWPINANLAVTDNTVLWTCGYNPVVYNLDFTGATAIAHFKQHQQSSAVLLTLTESSGISLVGGVVGVALTVANIDTLAAVCMRGVWNLIVTFPSGPTPFKLYGDASFTIEGSV